MIYTIYCDGYLIHTSNIGYGTEGYFVESPSLTKTENESDKLTFNIPYTNINYDKIIVLASTITVIKTKQNGEKECIFYGRPVNYSVDINLTKSVECEGAYSFFNDVLMYKRTITDKTPREIFNILSNYYNNYKDKNSDDPEYSDHKSIKDVRKVTLTIPENQISTAIISKFKINFDSIKTCLVNLMAGRNMHMYQVQEEVTDTDDERYALGYKPNIIYQEDYNAAEIDGPVILFGENLTDYTRSMNLKRYATSVIPLGKTDKDLPFGYLDIQGHSTIPTESNAHRFKRIVVTTNNTNALDRYGIIQVVKYYRKINDPIKLRKKAQKWLDKTQFEDLSFNISAVDISDLNSKNGIENFQYNHDEIKLLDRVRIISPPHALDAYIPVTSISYDLSDPSNTNYTFGNVRTHLEGDTGDD